MYENIFPTRSAITFLFPILIILCGCIHRLSKKEALIQKLKGEWIEVKRTNTENSSFNKHFGTFYSPDWHLTITDSNYLFVKIKDSPTVKKYPYDIFYDSILVLAGQYWNNLYIINKPDSVHLTLIRLPIKYDPYPTDTLLYHFIRKKYYRQMSIKKRRSLSGLDRMDTLYVSHLIHSIIPPEPGKWGTWYKHVFMPENPPTPKRWSKNIKIYLDTNEYPGFPKGRVYDITIKNTGHNISLGYDRIEIDTSGKIYTGGYVDEKKIMYPLFKKYVQFNILWKPATTLGYKHPADIKANIHYRE